MEAAVNAGAPIRAIICWLGRITPAKPNPKAKSADSRTSQSYPPSSPPIAIMPTPANATAQQIQWLVWPVVEEEMTDKDHQRSSSPTMVTALAADDSKPINWSIKAATWLTKEIHNNGFHSLRGILPNDGGTTAAPSTRQSTARLNHQRRVEHLQEYLAAINELLLNYAVFGKAWF